MKVERTEELVRTVVVENNQRIVVAVVWVWELVLVQGEQVPVHNNHL